MNNPTDAELSRAVAEKLGRPKTAYENAEFATNWQLIGPEIEKRFKGERGGHFVARLMELMICEGETLPRAACLAILEE